MSSELAYDLPKKQLINSTFVRLTASTTGGSPYANPNVVAGELTTSTVSNAEKYYEIKVVLGDNTYWVYQNVQTGGFIFADNNNPGTNVTESTTATLWVKTGGSQYTKLSPAQATSSPPVGCENIFIKLTKDNVAQPLVLGSGEEGTQWSLREVREI